MKFYDKKELSLLNRTKVKLRSNVTIHYSKLAMRSFLIELDLIDVVIDLDEADILNKQVSNYGHLKFDQKNATVWLVLDGICTCGGNVIKKRSVMVKGDSAVILNNAILEETASPLVPKPF